MLLEAAMVVCLPHPQMVERLDKQFNETLHIQMLQNPTTIIEVYINEDTGTWTFVALNPQGVACIVRSGIGVDHLKVGEKV